MAPGAIPWLLRQVVGAQVGPIGEATLTGTTYIQRLDTSGGIAPSTGCAQIADVGKKPPSVKFERATLVVGVAAAPLVSSRAGTTPVTVQVLYLLPSGAPVRVDEPAPPDADNH